MKITIDRFEGYFAVVELEDKKTENLPLSLVPKGAKEGDVLDIKINASHTKKRKNEISKLMSDVWEK